MRVLVTRPAQDGADIARALRARGHEPLLAPLLTVRLADGPPLALDGVQAFLATSANGVRALAHRVAARDMPVFAVGPQTAQAASDAGFRHVRNADGDARALALQTAQWTTPGQGALLHVVGEGNDGALAKSLTDAGFTVRREILYAVLEEECMPDAAAAALRAGTVDAALFFSPRSARVFVSLAQRDALPVKSVIAACISAATAGALMPLQFTGIRVAAAPNQAALLDCLDAEKSCA